MHNVPSRKLQFTVEAFINKLSMLLQIIRSTVNIRIKVKNNRKEEKEKKARRNLGTGKKHDDKKQQKTRVMLPSTMF
jgi:hypothetical protein